MNDATEVDKVERGWEFRVIPDLPASLAIVSTAVLEFIVPPEDNIIYVATRSRKHL